MHKIKINTDYGLASRSTKIMLDERELEGVKALDVRMRVNEVVSVTAVLLPELIELEYLDADVFINIGDRKYKLMECVADAKPAQECEHDFEFFCDMGRTVKCKKCGFQPSSKSDGEG